MGPSNLKEWLLFGEKEGIETLEKIIKTIDLILKPYRNKVSAYKILTSKED